MLENGVQPLTQVQGSNKTSVSIERLQQHLWLLHLNFFFFVLLLFNCFEFFFFFLVRLLLYNSENNLQTDGRAEDLE